MSQRICILLMSLLALASCQTVQTTSSGAVGVERKQHMMVSSAQMEQAAAQSYAQTMQQAQAKGILNRDPAQLNRVRTIAQRLIPAAGAFRPDALQWRWEVNVLSSKEINAWCMAGAKMLHVPYKSEPPAVVDLISGQVQVMVSSYSTIAGHLKSGRLRALATALPQRSSLLPDVPTVAEAGMPKFSIIPWAGLLGPANMPRPVTERLNREFNTLLKRPDIRAQLDQNAFAAEGTTPEFLGDWVRTQLDVWGRIMREAGIQPE